MARVENGDLHVLEFASRMVVMAFVRATCSRGGSVCKDWLDRAGLMLHWLTRNVLSVGDFTWMEPRGDGAGDARRDGGAGGAARM